MRETLRFYLDENVGPQHTEALRVINDYIFKRFSEQKPQEYIRHTDDAHTMYKHFEAIFDVMCEAKEDKSVSQADGKYQFHLTDTIDENLIGIMMNYIRLQFTHPKPDGMTYDEMNIFLSTLELRLRNRGDTESMLFADTLLLRNALCFYSRSKVLYLSFEEQIENGKQIVALYKKHMNKEAYIQRTLNLGGTFVRAYFYYKPDMLDDHKALSYLRDAINYTAGLLDAEDRERLANVMPEVNPSEFIHTDEDKNYLKGMAQTKPYINLGDFLLNRADSTPEQEKFAMYLAKRGIAKTAALKHLSLIQYRNMLSKYYYKKDRLDEAVEYLKETLEVKDALFPDDNLQALAYTYRLLGKIHEGRYISHHDLDDLKLAENYFIKQIELLEQLFKADDSKIKKATESLERVSQMLSKQYSHTV